MLANRNCSSPFPPITSLQPQSLHAVTHSLAQRRPAICLRINPFRTLSIATGWYPPRVVPVTSHHCITPRPALEIDPCGLGPRWVLERRTRKYTLPSELASPFNAVFRHSMHGNTIHRKVSSHTANSGKLFFVTEGSGANPSGGPKRVR